MKQSLSLSSGNAGRKYTAPSYSGLVRRPLTAVTRVRIPLGSPWKWSRANARGHFCFSAVDHSSFPFRRTKPLIFSWEIVLLWGNEPPRTVPGDRSAPLLNWHDVAVTSHNEHGRPAQPVPHALVAVALLEEIRSGLDGVTLPLALPGA